MPLQILRGDIVNMNTDAIVNAANSALQAGGGVCGAIFQAAGHQPLQEACDKIGHCPVGQSVITPGFSLASRHIIHTVGPIWQGGTNREEELLRSCYRSSLELAKQNGLKSVAFPLISSGIYGYPKEQSLRVATEAINEFLLQNDMEVTLVVFDKTAFQLSQKLVDEVHQYIDDHYAEDVKLQESDRMLESYDLCSVEPTMEYQVFHSESMQLEELLDQADETFSQRLIRLIDKKEWSDTSVYKRANVSRQLFSLIRSKPEYQPKKETALAFCVALELDLDDTLDLLASAGFTLSQSKRFDLIIQYYIEKGDYDINLLNQTLFKFDQKLLGV